MKAIVLAKPNNLEGTLMKAIVCTKYGPPDVLKLEEIQKPTPGDDEILVEVHAASVNYSNLILVRGKPFLARLGFGLLKPKLKIPGSDIAGRVEAVGRNAKQFRPGDEVFGDLSNCGRGGYAEYVCVPENVLALKPANISFEEAAAVPEAALVAMYVATGGSMAQIFQGLLIGPLISMTGRKKMGNLLVKPNKDLAFMKELIEAGKVKPVIDRRYTLSEVAEALRYYGEGHARGKVVITVEHDNKI
jgi:NADPH:quinone reductase-like Zn-dependent oxidoreductase